MKKITYICDYCGTSTPIEGTIKEIEAEVEKLGKRKGDVCSENCAKKWAAEKLAEIYLGS